MLRWIKRLTGKKNTGHNAEKPEVSPEEAMARRISRELQAEGTHSGRRVSIAPEDKGTADERREGRKERRSGRERRSSGHRERRKRDIPVKNEKRRHLWDRRKQYGERRFNPDRRKQRQHNLATRVEHNEAGMLVIDAPDLMPDLVRTPTAASYNNPTTVQGFAQQEAAAAVETVKFNPNLVPVKDAQGVAHAQFACDKAAGEYILDVMPEEGIVPELDCSLPDGRVHLRAGAFESGLLIPTDNANARVIVTLHGDAALRIGASSRGEWFFGMEKQQLNIGASKQVDIPITTLLVDSLQADMAMQDPQTFRFGQLLVHFDLTQVVEIQAAEGRRIRISGPAGKRNFEQYLEVLRAQSL